jgi:hypothetical protein
MINITVVVNADFRNYEAGLIITDQPVADPDCTHGKTPWDITHDGAARLGAPQLNITSAAVWIARPVSY